MSKLFLLVLAYSVIGVWLQLTWLSNEVGDFDFVLSTCFDRAMNPAGTTTSFSVHVHDHLARDKQRTSNLCFAFTLSALFGFGD